jgi:hypothetical protein
MVSLQDDLDLVIQALNWWTDENMPKPDPVLVKHEGQVWLRITPEWWTHVSFGISLAKPAHQVAVDLGRQLATKQTAHPRIGPSSSGQWCRHLSVGFANGTAPSSVQEQPRNGRMASPR